MKLAVAVLAIAGLTVAGIHPRKPDAGKPLCEIADEWAVENAENLPTDLDGLLEHEPAYRRAILRHSSREVRAGIWREHLKRIQVERDDFTPIQMDFVSGVLARVDEFYAYEDTPDLEGLQELSREARKIFGDVDAAIVLARLGETRWEPPAADEPDFEECECAEASDWCLGINMDCIFGGCERTGYECGTLGLFICDGMCELNPTDN